MTVNHDSQSDQMQKTPKGEEIPVPNREDVENALDKLAKSKKPSLRRRPKK
jgi:hypothetical protein